MLAEEQLVTFADEHVHGVVGKHRGAVYGLDHVLGRVTLSEPGYAVLPLGLAVRLHLGVFPLRFRRLERERYFTFLFVKRVFHYLLLGFSFFYLL